MIDRVNRKPSEKSVYFWNITGSIANALLSLVVLMIVTRVLKKEDGDIFSIAWAIGQLMLTIGTFQIRLFQATDVMETYKFKQYLAFRILTTVLMIVGSVLYIFAKGYHGYKAVIILLMCLYRAIDSLADVYEGWFQQKERLDLAGKALTYRVTMGVLVFGMVLGVSGNLLLGCISLNIVYLFCFLLFDVGYAKRGDAFSIEKLEGKGLQWMWTLLLSSVPLFFNAFLMMSINNAPKIAIDSALERGLAAQGMQVDFSILFMPASFLVLAYIVFRPMLTQMALYWNLDDKKGYLGILARILGCLGIISIVILLGSAVIGIPCLSIVYGVDLSPYKMELLLIVLGGCIYTFATVIDNAMTVMRKQHMLIIAYLATWLYMKAVSYMWVMENGIYGAALSYLTGMAVFFIITLIISGGCYRNLLKKKTK